MHFRVTIKDIAALAGVSPGTVDRVLHKRGNVSSKAREQIERAMQELNYEPNYFASALAHNRTLQIKVLLPDYRSDLYWEQPYAGVEKAAHAARHFGCQVDWFFFNLDNAEDFCKQSAQILETSPDVLLFAPIFQEEAEHTLQVCAAAGVQAVLINTNLEDQQALCYVGQVSFQSGVLAGKLLALSVSPGDALLILHLDKQISDAKHLLEKERGLRHFFEQHAAVAIHRIELESFEDSELLRHTLLLFFEEYPAVKAVFVSNSRAYRVLDALGSDFPADIRLVGFDLIPPNLNYLESGQIDFLINQNPAQQGYQAIMNVVDYFIFKRAVERVQYLPLDIVVAENAAYYISRLEGTEA